MHADKVLFQVTRENFRRFLLIAAAAVVLIGIATLPLQAQKAQEVFKDKFKIADEAGGVSVATSSDGKYVFVAGKKGVLVSDDHGKTGSWVQTVAMK